MLTVNDSNLCKGDVISVTCSADAKPDVDTYQLFENDIPVADSDTSRVWKRTMSAQGSFIYRCVANNTAGTSDKNVTVTVSGNWYFFFYIEDITRWREDMNFIFEWQNNILRTSAASE